MKNLFTFKELDYSKNEIRQIIYLIRRNLDPIYTEEFFKWKHLENPFGKSYGLLALDGEKIVGVRMFMFWEFQIKYPQKTLTAIRPVDTVVDENYRGMGLFKQLTIQGLKECSGKYDLIFNTPNENSLPGYLKMGWKILNTAYFKVGVLLPSFSKGNLDFGSSPEYISSPCNTWETMKNFSYLRWRFRGRNYKIVRYRDAFVIYSMAKANRLNQIVVQEVLGEKKELKILLRFLAKTENAYFVYYYSNSIMDGLFTIKFTKKKSVVVIKDDSFGIGEEIIFSLGDLEGKL